MPHLALPEDMPGITAGFAFRPETARPLRELAHILLHISGKDGFNSRDRELIAAFVLPYVANRGRTTKSDGPSSLYFDGQLTQPWDAYVEYSGTFPQRGGTQHMIGFGTTYKPSPHQQLDFHCSFGLSAATPDHSIGLGYSVRFQVIRSK